MTKKFTLLFTLVLSAIIPSFSQDYAGANRLLSEKKFAEAENLYQKLLTDEPENPLANFGIARTIFLQTREQIYAKRNHNPLFESWFSEYERLKHAFKHALKAQETYRKADSKQKKMFSVSGIADHKEINALIEGIPKEAYDLIYKSDLQKPLHILMQIPPFNEFANADTVLRLRQILTDLSLQFEHDFKNNRNIPLVKNIRKTLLKDFTTIPNLRINGTGYGFLYEKYCSNILKDCDKNDLTHILQEFYGADYERLEVLNFKDFSEKIQRLASAENRTPLDFLCEMNLHYKGVNENNLLLYEKFIKEIAPAEIAWVALQKLSGFYYSSMDYDKCLSTYREYEALFPQKNEHIAEIVKILRTPSDDIKIVNLGAEINTENDETNPVSMPNGEGLFFCRKNFVTGQDIYSAIFENGKYDIKRFAEPIHSNTHEVPINISFDKTRFVFFGTYGNLPAYKDLLNAGSLGKGDIFFTFLKDKPLTVNVFPPPINSPDFEGGFCFTADGKAAVFVSDRNGSVGGYCPKSPPNRLFYHGGEDFNTDLWIAFFDNDKIEVKNLGNLNTPFAESNPYLHPDMKTIYFVSDGHHGIGGGDIFVATRLDDTWQNWSKPQNLGKSVNTPEKDGFFIDAYGQFAYISLKNKKPSFGGADIYRFEIPERFRPLKTIKITGNLLNEGKAVAGKVTVEDLTSGKIVSEMNSDSKTGKFHFELQSGKIYGLFTQKSGFYGESAALKLNENFDNVDIKLETVSVAHIAEKQKSLRLTNIFFETNSSELLHESESELRRLSEMLKSHKHLKIRVEGHTDNTGKENENLVLSEKRAKSVADYLIRLGVPQERVFYKGFGQQYPIADNKNEASRAKNRRVEFSLKPVN